MRGLRSCPTGFKRVDGIVVDMDVAGLRDEYLDTLLIFHDRALHR
jgi:hypothetical protein